MKPLKGFITAKLEVMPHVIALASEYRLMHPHTCWQDAQGAAYMAFREECQRSTIAMKERIGIGL